MQGYDTPTLKYVIYPFAYCKASIFRVHVFFKNFLKREMFRATLRKIYSLDDTCPRSYAPLLLNIEDSETGVTASLLNPAKDKNENKN